MLSFIELKNFKSFDSIKLDLRGSHGIPKKMAFVYGENGSGKSNLMSSLLFLNRTISTLKSQEKIQQLNERHRSDMFAESINYGVSQEFLKHLYELQFNSLESIIKDYKSLHSDEPMSIHIGFYIDGKEGSYLQTFQYGRIIYEELTFQLGERSGALFTLCEDKQYLSRTIFFDNDYRRELTVDLEKYWGKHNFISILYKELEVKNSQFVKKRVHNNLFRVLEWLDSLSALCKYNHSQETTVFKTFRLLQKLESGIIKDPHDKELLAFESALNLFFTGVYSDISGVYYKLTPYEDRYKYELIIKKQMNHKIVEIPITLESTGTRQLLEIFPYLISSIMGGTVLVDEIDSGIHDLLMYKLIEFLNESLKGQFIATTHNTLLMKQLPKENVYIIRSYADSSKDIVCINDYEFRTHKNNSIQNKYLEGDYAGIPYIGTLDFDEIVSDILEKLSEDDNNWEDI